MVYGGTKGSNEPQALAFSNGRTREGAVPPQRPSLFFSFLFSLPFFPATPASHSKKNQRYRLYSEFLKQHGTYGSGATVASETAAPNMFVNLVQSE